MRKDGIDFGMLDVSDRDGQSNCRHHLASVGRRRRHCCPIQVSLGYKHQLILYDIGLCHVTVDITVVVVVVVIVSIAVVVIGKSWRNDHGRIVMFSGLVDMKRIPFSLTDGGIIRNGNTG